jgi:hypothetical protein
MPYAQQAGATSTEWANELFEDVTHGGSYVLLQPLGPNSSGSRVGLVGSKFYVEAIRDHHREDLLFVSRVTHVYDTQAQGPPLRYDAAFHRLLSKVAPPLKLDTLTDLFSRTVHTDPHDPIAPSPMPTPPLKPGPRLQRLLRDCQSETRRLFRPCGPPSPIAPRDLISAVRRLWRRHRLESCIPIGVDPRTLAILAGTVTPPHLSGTEARAIASVFGIGMLNRLLANQQGRPEEALALLEEMAALPLVSRSGRHSGRLCSAA